MRIRVRRRGTSRLFRFGRTGCCGRSGWGVRRVPRGDRRVRRPGAAGRAGRRGPARAPTSTAAHRWRGHAAGSADPFGSPGSTARPLPGGCVARAASRWRRVRVLVAGCRCGGHAPHHDHRTGPDATRPCGRRHGVDDMSGSLDKDRCGPEHRRCSTGRFRARRCGGNRKPSASPARLRRGTPAGMPHPPPCRGPWFGQAYGCPADRRGRVRSAASPTRSAHQTSGS